MEIFGCCISSRAFRIVILDCHVIFWVFNYLMISLTNHFISVSNLKMNITFFMMRIIMLLMLT